MSKFTIPKLNNILIVSNGAMVMAIGGQYLS
jgi:hypothetical protein